MARPCKPLIRAVVCVEVIGVVVGAWSTLRLASAESGLAAYWVWSPRYCALIVYVPAGSVIDCCAVPPETCTSPP